MDKKIPSVSVVRILAKKFLLLVLFAYWQKKIPSVSLVRILAKKNPVVFAYWQKKFLLLVLFAYGQKNSFC